MVSLTVAPGECEPFEVDLVGVGTVLEVAWRPATGDFDDVQFLPLEDFAVDGFAPIGLNVCPSGPVTEGGVVFSLQDQNPIWLWLETKEG